MQILHIAAPGNQRVNQALNPLIGQQPLQIQHGNPVVAPQHIDGENVVFHQLLCPSGQI